MKSSEDAKAFNDGKTDSVDGNNPHPCQLPENKQYCNG
jgi:hypothetical protein